MLGNWVLIYSLLVTSPVSGQVYFQDYNACIFASKQLSSQYTAWNVTTLCLPTSSAIIGGVK